MKFHILTLFPEMIMQGLGCGIIGRAVQKQLIALSAVNIRDYTLDKHGRVDDYPYGGGAGMLMQAQPVYDAFQAVTEGRKVRTVYVTPQGEPFTQKKAKEFSAEEELVLLCGHYEGIDERVLEEIVTDYISIGDYVLTGGELAAMVMVDAIARLVPGVLGNEHSAREESFFNDLLEYPQYSRPETWRGKRVPGVLLSGDHRQVTAWRLEQSKERTAIRRPDLYGRYTAKQLAVKQLARDKRNNIHMMESLARGQGEILYTNVWAGGEDMLLYDRECRICMLTAADEASGRRLAGSMPSDTELVLISQPFMKEILGERQYRLSCQCIQVLYTQKTPLPVRHKDIRGLSMESYEYVCAHYCDGQCREGSPGIGRYYVKERILAGAMYGVFKENELAGFGGIHAGGGLGMLYVDEPHRRQGMGASLEAYIINRMLELGWTPYGHIVTGNEASIGLQEKLGLYQAAKNIWWMEKRACK